MTGSVAPVVAAPRSAGTRAADRARDWAPPVLLLVGGLVAWELVVRVFGIKQFILPSPIAIAVAWQTYLPELFAAARYTFVEIVAGLVIGAASGHRGRGDHRALSVDAGLADAVRRRGELGPDPRVRAAVQQLVRPGSAAVEGDGRGGPVLLSRDDQHGPWPDHGRPPVDRAAALLRDVRERACS